MALDNTANFAISELASGITSGATSLSVTAGDGALFPDPSVANYNCVIWNITDYANPANDPNVEIVRVTAKSTDTFTITRAQESTSASAHNTAGKTYAFANLLTAKIVDDIETNLDLKLENVVEDTTPQLGGNLDSQTNNITDIGSLAIGTPTAGGTPLTVIETTGTGDSTIAEFVNESASPADGDTARIQVELFNDTSQRTEVGQMEFVITDVTDGTEDGEIRFDTMSAGSLSEALRIHSDGTISMDGGTTSISASELNLLDGLTNNLQDEFSKSITVESPSDAEDITMFETGKAITITEIRAVLRGSSTPSVTWTLRHNTDRSAAGNEVVTGGTTTTSTTTGDTITTFNDATIAADSWVWLETTAQSGTVDEINITVKYTID